MRPPRSRFVRLYPFDHQGCPGPCLACGTPARPPPQNVPDHYPSSLYHPSWLAPSPGMACRISSRVNTPRLPSALTSPPGPRPSSCGEKSSRRCLPRCQRAARTSLPQCHRSFPHRRRLTTTRRRQWLRCMKLCEWLMIVRSELTVFLSEIHPHHHPHRLLA